MTAPPATIGPDASLAAAGRVMHQRRVGRLLVADRADRLVGVVTRGDLLTVHDRLDAIIRDEVLQRVLRRTLMISPGTVRVHVDDGLVTLPGHVDRRSTVSAVATTGRDVAPVAARVTRSEAA